MDKTFGNFVFHETSIEGVFKIDVKKYGDNRGYFMETYKESDFRAAGIMNVFIQDNQSKSKKGVLRGLHFQKTFPQAKLVRCIEGEVFDVCVDMRKGSPTYGKWEGVVLSAEKGNQFMIPRGFAHGFVVLSETATFCYKCDELYHPEDEGGIMWNDPEVGIEWPFDGEVLLSEKDKVHPSIKDVKVEF
ncbi:MAG: dTDP-4-dehydrorhamnose 3,5-epimerase [Bacilli bacterium]|nr:dTDP-4-dehydrorhamnose 3,5-epimerase [Bacilli bacterium]